MKNEVMSTEEIFTMLRHDCDWARKKKERMVEQATTYLLWDASMLGFAVVFSDLKDIWNKAFLSMNEKTMPIYTLTIIVIIALIICVVAGVIYFDVMQVRKMENIEIIEYEEKGFMNEKLKKDYISILKSYDKTIEEYTNKMAIANRCLFVGAFILVIGVIVLKIII